MSIQRSKSLIVVLMVTVFVLTTAGSVFLGNGAGQNTADVDPANPPWSFEKGVGCADQNAQDVSGWLVETNSKGGHTLTFNQTFIGASDANVTLKSSAAGWYTLLVKTTDEDDSEQYTRKQGTLPENCSSGTSVQAAVRLPQSYSSFRVVHNGDTVVDINNSRVTTTRVWKLDEQNRTT